MIREMVCARVGGLVVVALTLALALALTLGVGAFGQTRSGPVDPGVRGGAAGGGGPLKGLTADETAFFQDGQTRFADVESVTKGANNGLGPRFNSNQCMSCHAQPEEGGSSPAQNPMISPCREPVRSAHCASARNSGSQALTSRRASAWSR